MKTYVFVEKSTSLVTSMATYPAGFLNPLEVHPDFLCIELPEPLAAESIEHLYYKDGKLLSKPESPGKFYVWDVSTETYVEDLEGAKEYYLKELRIAHKQGQTNTKAFYRNVWYNATSQAESDLISAIITEAFPQEWKTLDNQSHVLSLDEAKALLDKIRKVRLGYKESYWQLRSLVESAVSIAMIPVHSIETYVKENRQL